MNEINYGVSNIMGNELAAWQKSGKSIKDTVEETNKRQVQTDSVSISEEASRQQIENQDLYKDWELFMEQISNAESAEKFRVENPFKMELCASSIFGGDNLFQNYSECQYEVFRQWLDDNAQNISEESRSKILDSVKNATNTMDKLNALEGYRGTSFESVALLEGSRFVLENIKNTEVPESLRSDFEQLIKEYVRFNEEARDHIMERMTPDYIVEDIGKNTQYNKTRDELLSSQRSFYSREKEDVKDMLKAYYSETSNKDKIVTKLQQYTERYHKKSNAMYLDNSLFDKGLVSLMIPSQLP